MRPFLQHSIQNVSGVHRASYLVGYQEARANSWLLTVGGLELDTSKVKREGMETDLFAVYSCLFCKSQN
jgi:hypothetical protein